MGHIYIWYLHIIIYTVYIYIYMLVGGFKHFWDYFPWDEQYFFPWDVIFLKIVFEAPTRTGHTFCLRNAGSSQEIPRDVPPRKELSVAEAAVKDALRIFRECGHTAGKSGPWSGSKSERIEHRIGILSQKRGYDGDITESSWIQEVLGALPAESSLWVSSLQL